MEGEKQILIVDDEKDLVELLQVRFESEGFGVLVAYDGHEALRITREIKPDLIILDIAMPKLDGYEVCKIIKSDPTLEAIPIVIITGVWRDENRFVEEGVEAELFITKPFENDVLVNKVKQLLES